MSAPMVEPARGGAEGAVRLLLRAEGALVLLGTVLLYADQGDHWGVFALAFLLPDVSMLAYAAGPRVGAVAYNAAHSHVGPLLVAIVAAPWPWALPVACIWAAHIGFDRLLGFGLKYPHAFHATHLGRIGRARSSE